MQTLKTDEQLLIDHQSGDLSAMAEIDRRWRKHLLPYTVRRVESEQRAGEIVDDAFRRLGLQRGPLESVRLAMYWTVHHLSGSTIDWRIGVVLLTQETPL